jgi:putative sigma-54 modulation protein
MKCVISFRNMEHTPSIDERIKEKSNKLQKFLNGNAELNWTCWTEHNSQYAELKIHDGKKNYIATADSPNLYKSLDLVIGKIENQIQHSH